MVPLPFHLSLPTYGQPILSIGLSRSFCVLAEKEETRAELNLGDPALQNIIEKAINDAPLRQAVDINLQGNWQDRTVLLITDELFLMLDEDHKTQLLDRLVGKAIELEKSVGNDIENKDSRANNGESIEKAEDIDIRVEVIGANAEVKQEHNDQRSSTLKEIALVSSDKSIDRNQQRPSEKRLERIKDGKDGDKSSNEVWEEINNLSHQITSPILRDQFLKVIQYVPVLNLINYCISCLIDSPRFV
jgi:hypothetical protein